MSGLTNAEAPTRAGVSSGKARHNDASHVRYCVYIPPAADRDGPLHECLCVGRELPAGHDGACSLVADRQCCADPSRQGPERTVGEWCA